MDNETLHQELYKQIPQFKCKEGCTECCGPIPFSKLEWNKVKYKRKAKGLDCPYSLNGKCDIYSDRPLICRMYGTVEDLQCPHGCRPVALLSKEQAHEIMTEYLKLVHST